ncbi:hypothetical protein HMPREF1548_01250 [Clostridium sp. KLE 1755]|nr:hypothetical protein HMPREF1548_01250 [Clostridium sp. KLE 1755]
MLQTDAAGIHGAGPPLSFKRLARAKNHAGISFLQKNGTAASLFGDMAAVGGIKGIVD